MCEGMVVFSSVLQPDACVSLSLPGLVSTHRLLRYFVSARRLGESNHHPKQFAFLNGFPETLVSGYSVRPFTQKELITPLDLIMLKCGIEGTDRM